MANLFNFFSFILYLLIHQKDKLLNKPIESIGIWSFFGFVVVRYGLKKLPKLPYRLNRLFFTYIEPDRIVLPFFLVVQMESETPRLKYTPDLVLALELDTSQESSLSLFTLQRKISIEFALYFGRSDGSYTLAVKNATDFRFFGGAVVQPSLSDIFRTQHSLQH